MSRDDSSHRRFSGYDNDGRRRSHTRTNRGGSNRDRSRSRDSRKIRSHTRDRSRERSYRSDSNRSESLSGRLGQREDRFDSDFDHQKEVIAAPGGILGSLGIQVAPIYVSRCFRDIETLDESPSTEAGKNFIVNDTRIVDASDILDGSFVMAPQTHQEICGDPVSSDILSKEEFIFAIVKGVPHSRTRLMFVGQTCSTGLNSRCGVLDLFSIATPTHFLVPSGLYLEMAEAMLCDLKLKKSASLPSAAASSTTSLTGNKLIDNVKGAYLQLLDGGKYFTRNTKELMSREADLNFLMRTTRDREMYFMRNDSLDSDRYLEFILSASKEEQPKGSALESALLCRNISGVIILENKEIFLALLLGRFTGATGGKLSVTAFNPQIKGWLTSYPTQSGKDQIVLALVSLRFAFMAILSPDFKRCFDSVIKAFQGVRDPYRRVADDFMLYTVEDVCGKWGIIVGTLKRAPLYPEIDLSNAKGCAFLLENMLFYGLKKISQLNSEQALDRDFRLRILPTLSKTCVVDKGGLPTGVVAPVVSLTNACSHWFAGGLKVKDANGAVVKCTFKPCPRNHVKPSQVTKEAAIQWATASSLKSLKDGILQMAANYPAFKK